MREAVYKKPPFFGPTNFFRFFCAFYLTHYAKGLLLTYGTIKQRSETMPNKIEKFEVRRPESEGPCSLCGNPVYVGDSWFTDTETGEAYCSTRCLETDRDRVKTIKVTSESWAIKWHEKEWL